MSELLENEVSVLIGGKAGEGISSAGQIIAQLLGNAGYRVHMYLDYPSLIQGGHNFAVVRAAEKKPGAIRTEVNFIIAFNNETLKLHASKLSRNGVVIYDSGSARFPGGNGIPIREILEAEKAPMVMGNSAMIGAFARSSGLGWDRVETVFRKSMPKGTEQNLKVAEMAYNATETRLPIPQLPGEVLPVVTGNEAISIGLLEGGLEIYFAYPMSPASNILHFLAANAREFHIRTVQPEGEIAVALMALGSAFAGTRAAVGTSGGGFSLMTEAVSMAGIAELPLVIVLGQRTGPSTGLATYTAQADLHFALNAGQGDVPKCIIAPGDADSARKWSGAAMDLAWTYQVPVILLSDKIICEGLYSMDEGTGPDFWKTDRSDDAFNHPYRRYSLNTTGISPLKFPPLKGETVRVNSHVHDEDGITTEESDLTKKMADKRKLKMAGLKDITEKMHPVSVGGDPESPVAILCWGSNGGICNEIGENMGLRVVQPEVLWPFPEKAFSTAMEEVDRFIAVECNETGQLARLVAQFGYNAGDIILKYDGRPFMVEELEQELGRVIK